MPAVEVDAVVETVAAAAVEEESVPAAERQEEVRDVEVQADLGMGHQGLDLAAAGSSWRNVDGQQVIIGKISNDDDHDKLHGNALQMGSRCLECL